METQVLAEGHPLFIGLLVLQIAATLFFPGMMLAYWYWVVQYRMEDIRSKLWNHRAIRLYIKLFTGLTVTDNAEEVRGELVQRAESSTREFNTILLRDFRTVHSRSRYVLSVLSSSIVVGINVWACCAWARARLFGSGAGAENLDMTIIMALSGAYVWSVFEVLGRYRTRDLTPEDLMEMFLRNVAAVPIGYAFSLLGMDKVEPAMAFACAAFPLRELKLVFKQRALKKPGEQVVPSPRGGDGRLGTVLNSLGDFTLVRLEELQILTYMDLAYVNPTRLMAKTGYSLRLILTWIDQALLVVYAAPHVHALVTFGVPCALDAKEFYHEHILGRPPEEWRVNPPVIAMAEALKVSVESVREILKRIDEDPHVNFVQAIWHEGKLASYELAKAA